jgi:hypothetical protein
MPSGPVRQKATNRAGTASLNRAGRGTQSAFFAFTYESEEQRGLGKDGFDLNPANIPVDGSETNSPVEIWETAPHTPPMPLPVNTGDATLTLRVQEREYEAIKKVAIGDASPDARALLSGIVARGPVSANEAKSASPSEQQYSLEWYTTLFETALSHEGVADETRLAKLVELLHIIMPQISSRPKWNDRSTYPQLAKLTAPMFLKRVHTDRIIRHHVYKETIRGYDPDLMDAVESYISTRIRRTLDLGDAKDLILVASKPATNKVHRPAAKAILDSGIIAKP